MGCGEDPGPGRPVHFLVLGSSLTLTVLSSWTQVYLSVKFSPGNSGDKKAVG